MPFELREKFFTATGLGKSPKLGQELFAAIRDWDVEKVDQLLAAGADPNVRSKFFDTTPLFDAADKREPQMINALLEHGAQPNVVDKLGRTPLFRAVLLGDPEPFHILMAHGADPLAGDEKCRASIALSAATRGFGDALGPLLDAGVVTHEPNAQGDTLERLLQLSLEWGQPESVALLLKAGARADVLDVKGRSALELAVLSDNAECVDLILKSGGDISVPSSKGASILNFAVVEKKPNSVKRLIEAGCNAGERDQHDATLLHYAADAGCAATMEHLMAAGAGALATDEWGRSPLHGAVWHKHADCVRLLLKAGANPDEKYGDSENLTHFAACFCETDVMQALIEGGADINATDKYGNSVLRIALKYSYGKAEMVKTVLAAGADTRNESPDSFGKDAKTMSDQEFAQTRCPEVRDAVNEAAKKFLIFGAARDGDGVEVERFLADGIPPDTVDRDGKTALAWACASGKGDPVHALLAHGAKPDFIPKGLRHAPIVEAVAASNAEGIKYLCHAGVSPDTMDENGNTLLCLAAGSGDAYTVKTLLRGGANPTLESLDAQTPLFAALASGCVETVDAIAAAGAKVLASGPGGKSAYEIAEQSGSPEMRDIVRSHRLQEIAAMAKDATTLSQSVSPLKSLRFKRGP